MSEYTCDSCHEECDSFIVLVVGGEEYIACHNCLSSFTRYKCPRCKYGYETGLLVVIPKDIGKGWYCTGCDRVYNYTCDCCERNFGTKKALLIHSQMCNVHIQKLQALNARLMKVMRCMKREFDELALLADE